MAHLNTNNSNMKTQLRLILTLFLALVMHISYAQDKTISGVVTDNTGLPLPGVNIIIKGTSTGTQSDFDGKYSLKTNVGSELVFSYLGLKQQVIKVGNSSSVNVTMEEDSATLDEVVVVAYGTTSMEAFTGSASVIGEKELALRSVTSPIAAIEGMATGVQFTSASGQPGSSPGIIIRGVGTLNGSTDPLYIVDGVQYEGS